MESHEQTMRHYMKHEMTIARLYKELLIETQRNALLGCEIKTIRQENMSLQISLARELGRNCAFYGAPLWRRLYLALFPWRA